MKGIAERKPKDADVRDSLATMLVALRRPQEAEIYIRQMLEISKPSGEFYNKIGVLYDEMNNPEKAVEYFRKAAELKPHHVIYLSLAGNLKQLGKTGEVEEAYKKALEIKPDSIYVLKTYADFLRDEGRRQEALEMYKRAVAVEPTNAPVVYNLSVLYAKTGNLELARQYYEMLKTIDPAQAKILNRLMRLK
jgi:tetratricopeptide (TPR) repeat protein